MKLNSFTKIVKRLEERSHFSKRTGNKIKLVKLLFTVIVIVHLVACIWSFVGLQEIA